MLPVNSEMVGQKCFYVLDSTSDCWFCWHFILCIYLFILFHFIKKKINCLPCCSLPTWRRASWARTWLCRCRTASWTWVRGRGSGSVSTGTGPALERLVPRYGLLFQFSVMANSPYSALRPTLPVPRYDPLSPFRVTPNCPRFIIQPTVPAPRYGPLAQVCIPAHSPSTKGEQQYLKK